VDAEDDLVHAGVEDGLGEDVVAAVRRRAGRGPPGGSGVRRTARRVQGQ
jgi:hypothetical protein